MLKCPINRVVKFLHAKKMKSFSSAEEDKMKFGVFYANSCFFASFLNLYCLYEY